MIGVSIRFHVNTTIKPTYRWVVHEETPVKMVRKWYMLPGFQSYQLLSEDWTHERAYRRVTLTDGSQLTETITTLRPFSYFDYELTEFTSPLMNFLFLKGKGQWWFESSEGGTEVMWKYSFEPTRLTLAPIVWLFTKLVYKHYMLAAIEIMQRREMLPSKLPTKPSRPA